MALIDRVKFDGLASRDWLVYKYPGEEFVTSTQLIVGEGQAAVFVKGGLICDCFFAGTYTLSTPNIPVLNKLINLPFGGKTPFTAEIYFINRTTKLDLNWGTIDPIQVIDPKYQTKLRVRGFGQVGLKVQDYRLFLAELIGTMGSANVVSFDKVVNFFRSFMMAKIKTIIADAIINKGISALEISAKLDDISEYGKVEIEGEFAKYGITVVNFYIASINFPDEDFEAINKILKDRAAFELMGDNRYVSKRSFDVMETMAGNEGMAGGMMGAGMGMGMGMAAGAGLAGGAGAIAQNLSPAAPGPSVCAKCGTALPPGSLFCPGCGQPVSGEAKCPRCGSAVKAGQRFCNRCGQKLIDN